MSAVDAITGEIVEQSPNLWLDGAVGHHVEGDLNYGDAEVLTAKIKAYAGATWVLLYAAHERKAHKALGYDTWEDYVRTEFDMSRSRSYQLISQARVVLEISAAVSTDVDISEAEARDLAPVLDEAKDAVAKAVQSLPDDATEEQRHTAARGAVEQVRAGAQPAKTTVTERVTETRQTVTEPLPQPHDSDPADERPDRDPDAVSRGVEKAHNPDLTYRLNVTKAIGRAQDLVQLDVDRAVATAGESADGHRLAVQSIHAWCERYLQRSRPSHLRCVR